MSLAHAILRIAGFALLGMAAASLGLALWLGQGTLAFTAGVEHTTGRVVDHRSAPRQGGGVVYTPIVAFTTADGRQQVFAGQLSAGAPRFAPGAAVPVVYPAADPARARIDLFVDNWLGPLAACVVGVTTLVAGLLLGRRAGSTS
jgi:hypothetical protein